MKKLVTSLFFALMLLCTKAQYTTVYENSFRNWAPGQGWVMINNDTIQQPVGQVTQVILAGTGNSGRRAVVLNNMLGLIDTGYWSFTPFDVSGNCDKIMITPPLALGADPYASFYSRYKQGATMEAFVISNPADTTLSALTNNILSCQPNGFNVISLNSWANTTIRIAFRLTGQNTHGYIDDLKVLNRTSFANIPDSSFRQYLRNLYPSAFVGYQFNYMHPDVIKEKKLECPNCGIKSLEGLQYFPGLKYLDFSNNQVSYIPANPLYYIDSARLSNNLLNFIPPMPLAMWLYMENNLVSRIPLVYNNAAFVFYAQNNSILDCLPGTNRFVDGNFKNNILVDFQYYTYYSMQRDTPYENVIAECRSDVATISGVVYLDENMDGDYNIGETLLPNQRILFSQGGYVFTHQYGDYSASIDSGTINMNVLDLPANFTCTNPLNTSVRKNDILTHNFRIIATTALDDLGVTVSATPRIRPGGFISIALTARNYGTTTKAGVVKMYLPPGYNFQNMQQGAIVSDTVVWPVTLQPFHTQNNWILIRSNYAPFDTIRLRAVIETNADNIIANNRDSCTVIILDTIRPPQPPVPNQPPVNGYPFDPNNKLVDKPEVTPGFSGYLTYNINFENIGTGNATRVKVRDYLPHTLDFSTFEMLGASHPYTVNWSSDSIVEFVFYPIALTPKSIDSVNSHGHIWYRIKPLQPMAAGSYISNSAGIYFDDEDVVNTEACMVRAGQLHASFTITDTFQCGTERTVFRDQSPGTLFSRKWYFDGATPATATDKQPQVSYATTGTYKVTLVVTSRDYSDSLIQYVNVVVQAAPVATITASGPTTFCKGDSVTLTVNGNPGLTYVWNDGQTGNQVTLKSGYGYVIVSDSLGCKTSVYQPLTIGNPQPDISNTNGCENPVALLKLNTNFARRLWSTGDTTATITVNQYGAYRVTVTDAYGCQASDTFNFIFRAKPRPDIIGDTINCRFTTTNLSLTQVYTTYLWSNNTTTPVLKNISGNNTYRVTVTDQYGCVGSDTFIHRIYNSGSESIVEGLRDCSTRGYKVTTTGTNLRGLRWDTGDTTTVTYLKTPGNHSIAFTHNDGCVSTYSVNALVDYKYNLTARAYDTAFLCPGQNLQLSATYNKGALTAPSAGCTNANVATLGTGTFIENSSNTQPPAMFSNYKKGTRSAMLIKASELQTLLGGAKLITQVAYNIATLNSSAPLQNFSIRIAPTTLSQIYDFTPKYQMGEVYQATTVVPVLGWNTFTLTTPFYWDGSSNIIIDVNSFNPTTQGAVPNKVYCSNSGFGSYICAWDTFNLSNYNIATGGSSSGRPNIRFSYCTPVATAQPINSNNLTWSWYGGNATVADTTAAYTQATLADSLVTFVVTVSDTFGCNETAVLSLPGRTINQLMINAGSGNLCAGGTVQLCATPGMNNYLWNIGATSACYTANTVGSYSVVAQDNRGCAGADTITLTAGNGGTVIHLTADKTTICPGEVANICAVGGAAGYQWNTNQITDCITANAPGIYTLNTSGGCVTADSITLQQRTVLPLNITATKTQLCPNESAQICINNVGGSYSWSTGGTTACITAGNAGVYKVAVVDANQCIATDSITIQTLTVQPLNITATKTQLCPNESAQICINNVGGSYSWNTGSTAACITTSSAGVYKVAVVDANQCTATDSITIQQRTVLPLNIAATKTQLCPNDSAQICINNVGGSYSWSNGGTAACITAGNAGMYKVAVVDANQCTTLDSIEIQQAIITPVVITSLKTSLCGGDSITVCTAISSAGYLWNTQATDQCISVTDSGSYWVTATDLNTCTVESNHLTITKAPLPVINANSNILSTPASGTYQWYLNDTAIAGATTAAFTAVTSGNYKVLVTDTGGCQNYSNTLNVLYNGIVNTGTIKALQVKLYPNPFSAAFTVEIGNRNFKQVEFVLTNAIGQEILRDANTCFTDRFAKTFNLSALATGVYFVSTIVDGEKVVHRVVKE